MIFDTLAKISADHSLPFLLIGGHAVNVHGYSRATRDIDLLISRENRAAWIKSLERIGYTIFQERPAFLQFSSSAPGSIGIDLMLVNNSTFSKLLARAKSAAHEGATLMIVCVEHLIALKLHALKQGLEHRQIKDFMDVVELVRANEIDLQSAEMKEIFKAYGTEELFRRIKLAAE